MTDETTLWAWFLFHSGLPTSRAKVLLGKWLDKGLTLTQVLARSPAQARTLGATPDEAAKLYPPTTFPPEVRAPALRCNEPHYPPGLLTLSAKLRPALLFHIGEPGLLMQPIVYLSPGDIASDVGELFSDIVSLLLGEFVLSTAFRGTPQAEVLLAEMQDSEGEGLLFAAQGVKTLTLSDEEQTLIAAQRLLIATPLPPQAQPNPAWEKVLQQIALASAQRCIVSGTTLPAQLPEKTPTKVLSPDVPLDMASTHVQLLTDPTDLLLWFGDMPAAKSAPLPTMMSAVDAAAPLSAGLPTAPPPSPEETLQILSAGGNVPEALRRRLMGDN